MPAWAWALVGVAAVYAAVLGALVLAGRRPEARALARMGPDLLRLVRRLARDPRVPRGRRWALAALAAYLVLPFDLVPDVIPVAGVLDDVLVAVWVLRAVLRAAGPGVLEEHWPGSPRGLELLRGALRLAPA